MQAAMRPVMIVAHSEAFMFIIAIGQFFIHCFEQSFDLAIRCWTMNPRPDVLNASLLAPAIKLAVFTLAAIRASIITQYLFWLAKTSDNPIKNYSHIARSDPVHLHYIEAVTAKIIKYAKRVAMILLLLISMINLP